MDLTSLIIPISILGGLGLIFGIGLGIASKMFAVDKDPHFDEILELLPGANCGGCGYPGCEGLAEAVCRKEANITSCGIMKEENAKKASKILGIEIIKLKERHARVLCSGGRGISRDEFDYDGLPDCRSVNKIYGGQKKCKYACLGFGTCIDVCPFNAISINENGVARIETSMCTGCGMCVDICPRKCIVVEDEENRYYAACRNTDKGKAVISVCSAGCIACAKCAKECEAGAISMQNNLPVFDHDKCTNCSKCVEICPTHVIDRIKEEEW